MPSALPSPAPSEWPTEAPTAAPQMPSQLPSAAPTTLPSAAPTSLPSNAPTHAPQESGAGIVTPGDQAVTPSHPTPMPNAIPTAGPSPNPTCTLVCASDCACLKQDKFPSWHILASQNIGLVSSAVEGNISACGDYPWLTEFYDAKVGSELPAWAGDLTTLRVLSHLNAVSLTVANGAVRYGHLLKSGFKTSGEGVTYGESDEADAADCASDVAAMQAIAARLSSVATGLPDSYTGAPAPAWAGCAAPQWGASEDFEGALLMLNASGASGLRAGSPSFAEAGYVTACVGAEELAEAGGVSLELGGDDFLVVYVNRSGLLPATDLLLNQVNFMTGNLTLEAAAARVVWVLDPADGPLNMTISHLNFVGTVLAPTAKFRIQNAVLNGRAYVKSLHSETPHRISNSALMLPACSCGETAIASAASAARRMQTARQRGVSDREEGLRVEPRAKAFSELLRKWELGSTALFPGGGDEEAPFAPVEEEAGPSLTSSSPQTAALAGSAEREKAQSKDTNMPRTLIERFNEWELAVTGLFSDRR